MISAHRLPLPRPAASAARPGFRVAHASVSIINDQSPSPFILRQADSLFLPYGNFPHPQGLQKFDRASAAFVQANFAAAPNVPTYAGHPDVPGRPDSNPGAPALGWVGGISIGNDGATLAMKWSPQGRRAIEEANYRFYSPYWDLRKVPGGIQPVKLRSIGLTNSPRIAVPAISNDAPPEADALAAEKEELGRRLRGVSDKTLETILAIRHARPVPEGIATGEAMQARITVLIASGEARRTAAADVLKAFARAMPGADYTARFNTATRRFPELFS